MTRSEQPARLILNMWKNITFLVLLIGTCAGIWYTMSRTKAETVALESRYTDQINEIYKLQGKKIDPGFEPIEKAGDTNSNKGKRDPEFKGVGAVAGVSDTSTGLNPVGAITDKKIALPGSVIEISARSLYQRDGGYYCNSTYLSQYVLWIKNIPVMASYAPCVTRSTEFYWATKLKPEDIRIEYTNDTSVNQESNDLLVQDVLLDGKSVSKSTTNASWTLNQCSSYVAVPSTAKDLIMHCNGFLNLSLPAAQLATPEANMR